MRNPIHKNTACRLCRSKSLTLALKLSPSVPVDNYRPRFHPMLEASAYPMDLYRCEDCGHAQLLDVVDPTLLYGDYIYTSTSSPGLANHFRSLVEEISERLPLNPDDLVIDAGCNDGLLLQMFHERNVKTLGIDPSSAAIDFTRKRGLRAIQSYLTLECAEAVVADYGLASLVTATNVFSHADDLEEFAMAVSRLLRPDGMFVFEVSYLKNLLFSGTWDYVYHEHLAHHSVKPLERFLRRHGLELHSVTQISIKGGSIRCTATKRATSDLGATPHRHIRDLMTEESLQGLYSPDSYLRLGRFKDRLTRLTKSLVGSIPSNVSLCSYGASATSTVLSQELGYAPSISFVVDDNPARQNTLTPGYLAPVLPSTELSKRRPALLIMAAWRFRNYILPKCGGYLDSGGKIFIPLPSPSVISKGGEEFLEL